MKPLSQTDPMIEVFVFESQQLLESLEGVLLEGEKSHQLTGEQINEIFRTMHTIKGSASMMGYDNLAHVAHAVEDLFSLIRENASGSHDWGKIFDMVLAVADIIKADVAAIAAGNEPGTQGQQIIKDVRDYLAVIQNAPPALGAGGSGEAPHFAAGAEYSDAPFYKIKIQFEEDCQMESIRAFGVVNEITPLCFQVAHVPDDLMAESATGQIRSSGFTLYVQSAENPDTLKELVDATIFLKSASLIHLDEGHDDLPEKMRPKRPAEGAAPDGAAPRRQNADTGMAKQNFISVNVNKLDRLMDLVGEIVTTESMVTKNPEIAKQNIESFERSGQQMRKLINELRDTVMSIRMVPVSTSFHKMQRIVRDMSKKIGKEVQLDIIGEETEVDKNVIDTLNDPLMHLIRNAVDHGIETPDERIKKGKDPTGHLVLEARNTGGDVMILIQDDGKGLNRAQLISKATDKGLTTKADAEISDKEAFGFIFAPGFSTKDQVTEFSGRGVGMDVVRRNIEKIGGSISVDSAIDAGTTIQIRIPLTLAIIEGMKLRVGDLIFIVPILSMRQSIKPKAKDFILDPDGNEMVMIRGECLPVVRLHRLFDIPCSHPNLEDGILIIIENEESTFCLFVDELIGEQQAVIKPLPLYLQRHSAGMFGIGGCAILGDGSISLIIDINSLVTQ